MKKTHATVDWVRSVERPDHPLAAKTAARDRGLITVHLAGSSCLVDPARSEAATWLAVLEDLRAIREPVYLETDPTTNVVTQLLCPMSFLVEEIGTAPVNGCLDVGLHISHARHHLKVSNPDYQELLSSLDAARRHSTPVLVTATLDDHEIIDVRADPTPLVHGPTVTAAAKVGPLVVPLAATAVTAAVAEQMFSLVAGQSHIPFKYPDDGCWARAHEMCRLMLANLVQPRKVWIYGRLSVNTKNHPQCIVRWGWHVAPMLLVDTGTSSEVNVIDPAVFATRVTQATWASVQHDPQAALVDTDATVFHRSSTGQLTYDPNYAQTQQVLAQYRRALALRSSGPAGPPPYANCP